MNILFEVSPIDPATGTATTYRFASLDADASGTQLDNKEWLPVLHTGPVVQMNVWGGARPQNSDVTYGNVAFALTDKFNTTKLASWNWFDVPARCWVGRLGDPFSSYTKIFEGQCGAVSREGILLTVPLYGLDVVATGFDLLTQTYAGTGGAAGSAALKGKYRPVALGECLNVDPVLIDPANLVYQFHDGPAQAVTAVYENALKINDAGPKATYATYADLIAGAVAPGEWLAAPAVGMFRLGGQAGGKVTADVKGGLEGSTYSDTIDALVPLILKRAGVIAGLIDSASFAAFAGLKWSLYAREQASVGEIVSGAIESVGGYSWVGTDGKWRVADYFANRAAGTLNADRSSKPYVVPNTTRLEASSPPTWQVRVGGDRCWSVHSSGEIAKIFTADDVDGELAAEAKATADQAKADVAVALDRLAKIADDNLLSRDEKREYIRLFQKLTTDRTTVTNTANALGVSVTSFEAAYQALKTYLEGLSPSYSDSSQDTPIVASTWNQKWSAAENGYQTLALANSTAASKTAVWATITGPNKPADNADVTGNNTSKDTSAVNGVASTTVTTNLNTAINAIKDKDGNIVTAQMTIDKQNAEIERSKKDVADAKAALLKDIGDTNTKVTTVELQMSGANPSGLQTLIKNNRTNLADIGWWKKGAATAWSINGGAHNALVSFPDGTDYGGGQVYGPDGSSADVWLARADAGGNAAGGWNGGLIAPLDPDKTYRFVVPMVQLGAAGARNAYWGTTDVCNINTTTLNADGGGPYFAYGGNLPPNKWFLFVGFIFPRNSTGRTDDGAGIFNMVTGEKLSAGRNFCFHPDGRQVTHRAYQFYAYNGSQQAFGRPIIELVDGSETPFPALIPATAAANARITETATVAARDNKAVADRSTNIEASIAAGTGSYLNANENFSAWPDGQALPTGWPRWTGHGSISRQVAQSSKRGYALRHHSPAGTNSGVWQNDCRITPGWYVLEADVELLDGTLLGSGLTLSGVYNLDFAREADVNGLVSQSGFYRRRFTKLVQVTGTVSNFHTMTNWSDGFGDAYTYMDWYFAGVRPATDGEIKAQKVNDELYKAGGVLARISSNETTIADLPNKYAAATRVTTIEAQVSNASNNLLRNGIFNNPAWTARGVASNPPGWSSWENDNGAYIGPANRDSRYGANAPLQIDRGGYNNGLVTTAANLAPGWYAFEVDITGEDGNWSGSGIHANFNNGTAYNFAFAANYDTAQRIGDIGTANRQFTWLWYNPTNSPYVALYLMAGWTGFQGGTNFGFFRSVWHKVVMRPASAGEIEAKKVQDANLIAKVTTAEGAIAGVEGRTRSYVQTTAVAGNNRAQVTIRADANSGAGVDITGDVNISGNLTVDGSLGLSKVARAQFGSQMAVGVNGTWQPSPGVTQTVLLAPFGFVGAGGSFVFDYGFSFNTNAGTTGQGTRNGRPFYTHFLEDGGVGINIVDENGAAVASTAVGRNFFGRTTVTINNPRGGAFTGRILVTMFNNNYDSGVIDGGDYYERNVSGYGAVSNFSGYFKWTFI